MFKLKQSLIAFAGLSLLAGIFAAVTPLTGQSQTDTVGPAKPVLVVNSQSLPVPVTGTVNIGNPARHAFQQSLDINPGQPAALTVPEGQRLVIEFVSGAFDALPSTCLVLTLNVDARLADQVMPRPHRLIPVLVGTAPTLRSYIVSQETRIYADPGTTVTLSVLPQGCTSTMGSATVSGYLEDMP